MRFRVGGGRIGKLTLGRYAENEMPDDPVIGQPLTLAAARQLAAQVHRARALGRDPVAEHKAAKQRKRAAIIETASNTFAAAAKEFIQQYASRKVRRWKEQARLLGFQPTANGLDIIPGGLAQRWNHKAVGEIDGHDIRSPEADDDGNFIDHPDLVVRMTNDLMRAPRSSCQPNNQRTRLNLTSAASEMTLMKHFEKELHQLREAWICCAPNQLKTKSGKATTLRLACGPATKFGWDRPGQTMTLSLPNANGDIGEEGKIIIEFVKAPKRED